MRSRDFKLPDDVLQHVVVEKLRHILSLFNCAAMSVEALGSYRLVEANISDLEITWRKPSKRAASQALILKASVVLVFRSQEDPNLTRTLRDVMTPARLWLLQRCLRFERPSPGGEDDVAASQ